MNINIYVICIIQYNFEEKENEHTMSSQHPKSILVDWLVQHEQSKRRGGIDVRAEEPSGIPLHYNCLLPEDLRCWWKEGFKGGLGLDVNIMGFGDAKGCDVRIFAVGLSERNP